MGDRVIWMLAAEHRIEGFAEIADEGRRRHRVWVEAVFADALRSFGRHDRAQVLTALLAALDVYTWKLLRRDLELSRARTEATITRLVVIDARFTAALDSAPRFDCPTTRTCCNGPGAHHPADRPVGSYRALPGDATVGQIREAAQAIVHDTSYREAAALQAAALAGTDGAPLATASVERLLTATAPPVATEIT